jgi:DNA polymerase-3 subunit chi
MDVNFYHLTRGSVENALPVILRRLLARKQRATIRVADVGNEKILSDILCNTGDITDFLPHAIASDQKDGRHKDKNPIWISSKENDYLKGADHLILLDGCPLEQNNELDKTVILFDNKNSDIIEKNRHIWREVKTGKEQGNLKYINDVTYWQQNASGQWQEAAKL